MPAAIKSEDETKLKETNESNSAELDDGEDDAEDVGGETTGKRSSRRNLLPFSSLHLLREKSYHSKFTHILFSLSLVFQGKRRRKRKRRNPRRRAQRWCKATHLVLVCPNSSPTELIPLEKSKNIKTSGSSLPTFNLRFDAHNN